MKFCVSCKILNGGGGGTQGAQTSAGTPLQVMIVFTLKTINSWQIYDACLVYLHEVDINCRILVLSIFIL